VDSGYFRTLGTSSLRGRDFTSTDVLGSPPVAIVTEPLARLLWPGEDPLGQCITLHGQPGDPSVDCATIVGVVGGFWSWTILERGDLGVYTPSAQNANPFRRVPLMYVRSSGDPAAVAAGVRRAIQQTHRELPAVTITLMRDRLGRELRPWRLAATMFAAFGAVGLVIAAVGLYGVVAFSVAQRSAEMAVRMALGARTRNVLSAVAGPALRAVVVGLVAGTVVALGARRWIGPLLFQTSPSDPWIILGADTLLFVIAVGASCIPTARVLRRSPAEVLRVD
jgi:hypothetical protein